MTEAQLMAELDKLENDSGSSSDPWKLTSGKRADDTTLAHPMDNAGSVDVGIGDPASDLDQLMAQSEAQQRAVDLPSASATKAASGDSEILGTLGNIFAPGISSLIGLFTGGSKPATGPTPYIAPPSVNFSGSMTPGVQGVGSDTDVAPVGTNFDPGNTQGLTGLGPHVNMATLATPGPPTSVAASIATTSPASSPASSTTASSASSTTASVSAPGSAGRQAQLVTVSVSAMDRQSVMDRSSDIADAVRAELLQGHPISDVVSLSI